MKKSIIISIALLCCLISYNPVKNIIFAEKNDNILSQEQVNLTQEQSKDILINYNNAVEYIYQGNENDFEFLKSKDIKGYVFLPDTDTDIGYFVDKECSNIYYFHPSGYLELIK